MQKITKIPLKAFYFLAGKVFHQDDRIAMRLFDYFPSYGAAFGEFMNQVFRILRRSYAYDIQGIVIEPTNFCNLRCRHCAPQRITDSKKGYMKMELFKKILDDNPQITCLILTRNGEPFMHPGIFEMIKCARRKNIHVAVFTNGTLLNNTMIGKIFESGLNEINFSMEGSGEFYKYNRGKPYSEIESTIKKFLLERKKRNAPLKIAINAACVEDPLHLQNVKNEWSGIVDFITVEPLMGKKGLPRRSPCRTLWRNLVVTWNGDVVPCCVDMENKLIMGNANEKSLKEIYNNPKAREIRKRHVTGDYPDICKYCAPYFG